MGSIKDNLELWEWWKQGGEAWIHKKIWKRQGKGIVEMLNPNQYLKVYFDVENCEGKDC